MRDRYFATYQSIKYKECFYRAHYKDAYLKNLIYSGVLILISLVSATVWGISKSQPVIWAFIIGAAQLAQAFSPLLPWSEQLDALKYLMPELAKLVVSIDADWLDLDLQQYDSDKIRCLMSKYEETLCDLESHYVGTTYFSESKHIKKVANKEKDNYFYLRYPATKVRKEEKK